MAAGLGKSWEELIERDQFATLFQGPSWCVEWYRAYRNSYQPLLLVVSRGQEVVGIAALAVDVARREMVFAGGPMADYRDVLALSDVRADLLLEVVKTFDAAGYRHALQFGVTLPDSPSVEILRRICADKGLLTIPRSFHGWRWWPAEAKEDPFKSRSVKYKLNCLKRRGEVSAEVVRSRSEWMRLRDEFYQQHSLRQVLRGTLVSFDNPEKVAFYDALFDTPLAHVTVLRAGGKAVACHYGVIFNRVLYLGAPSFDIRDRQYSPGLLLVLSIMKHSASWGIAGFDLTLGEGDMKERCSTSRVDLSALEIYPRRTAYLQSRAALAFAVGMRRIFGDERWSKHMRPAVLENLDYVRNIRRMPVSQAMRYARETLLAPLCQRTRKALFRAVAPVKAASGHGDYRLNELYDLLRSAGGEYEAWRVMLAAGKVSAAAQAGSDFHTVICDNKLAAWGFSRILVEEVPAEAPGAEVGDALLHDFETLPGFEGELSNFIAHVAQKHFAAKAKQAWLTAENAQPELETAASRAGFTKLSAITVTRFPWREGKHVKAG